MESFRVTDGGVITGFAQQEMTREEQAIQFAISQQLLAERERAVGQCPECQMFRLDGKPPMLHGKGCSRQPSMDDVIRVGFPHLAKALNDEAH